MCVFVWVYCRFCDRVCVQNVYEATTQLDSARLQVWSIMSVCARVFLCARACLHVNLVVRAVPGHPGADPPLPNPGREPQARPQQPGCTCRLPLRVCVCVCAIALDSTEHEHSPVFVACRCWCFTRWRLGCPASPLWCWTSPRSSGNSGGPWTGTRCDWETLSPLCVVLLRIHLVSL